MDRLERYGNSVITPIDFNSQEMRDFIIKYDLDYEYVENKYADFVVLRTKTENFKFPDFEWKKAIETEDWIIALNKKKREEEAAKRRSKEKNEFLADTRFLRNFDNDDSEESLEKLRKQLEKSIKAQVKKNQKLIEEKRQQLKNNGTFEV